MASMVTLEQVCADDEMMAFIDAANEQLAALGYTEHGHRHGSRTSAVAGDILAALGYDVREVELARISGYLHDVGNLINRQRHPLTGALLAFEGLKRLGMPPRDLAVVMAAIGNHEEEQGVPVSPVAAAVVLADKADVHRSRVQNPTIADFDIHDRVNYAATAAAVLVDAEQRSIMLQLVIDTAFASVLNYFEIFLSRMVMMRDAAKILGCEYRLVINDVRLS